MVVLQFDNLPLGFRFQPTDEELVNHYLKRKIDGRIDADAAAVVPVVDLCKCEPWDLPAKSPIKSDDPGWFFFAPKDRKYTRGRQRKRATKAGHWKATGKDRMIWFCRPGRDKTLIGKKKTLVFYRGKAPRGERTGWTMHEYRTVEAEFESDAQDGFVLCRLFKKTIEKSSSASIDSMEKIVSSPTATVSSLGDGQQEPDVLEEFPAPANQEFQAADSQEETQLLVDKVVNSTIYPLRPEKDHGINTAASHDDNHGDNHMTEAAGAEDEIRLEDLIQFCGPECEAIDSDWFLGIGSPMQPNTDYSFLEVNNHDSYLQSPDAVDVQDGLSSEFFLNALCTEEEYSFEVSTNHEDMMQRRQISPWESVSGKESASSSDIETELAPEGHGMEVSELFLESPISSRVSLQVNNSSRNHEGICSVNDASSMLSATHSLDASYSMNELSNTQNFYNNGNGFEGIGIEFNAQQPLHAPSSELDESVSQENLVDNDFEGTGIKIRSRQYQNLPDSGRPMAQQGTAFKRIRLQRSIYVAPMSTNISGLTRSNNDDHEAKEATPKEGESPEENIAGAEVSNLSSLDELEGLSDHDEVSSPEENIAGAEEKDLSSLDHLEGLSDHDEVSSTESEPTLSQIPKESKPRLRLRREANIADSTLESLTDPMKSGTSSSASSYTILTGRSVIYVTCLILFVILLLFFGMCWFMTRPPLQVSHSPM